MKKLKQIPFYAIFTLILVSCSTEQDFDFENKQLIKLKESNEYQLLLENFPDLSKKIDYSSFLVIEKGDAKIYGMLLKENDKTIIGRVTFIDKNGNINGIVETYKYDNNKEINEFEYKNIYNDTFVSFDAKKVSNQTYSLKLDKSKNEKYAAKSMGWWSCTKYRIAYAFDACFDDYGCGMTCAIMLAVCPDAIVTAAALSCL